MIYEDKTCPVFMQVATSHRWKRTVSSCKINLRIYSQEIPQAKYSSPVSGSNVGR